MEETGADSTLEIEKEFVTAARDGDLLTIARFPLDRVALSWKRQALLAAAEYQRTKTVFLILESGVDPESRREAFLCAVEKGDMEIAQVLLSHIFATACFSAPNQQAEKHNFVETTPLPICREALLVAAEKGKTEMVTFLLSTAPDNVDEALLTASSRGNGEVVKILLEHVPPPSQDSIDLSLLAAVAGGNFCAAKFLARHGADLRAYEILLARCLRDEDYREIVNLLPKNKSSERLEKKLRMTRGVKCYHQARHDFLREIGLGRLSDADYFGRKDIF